MAEPLPIQRRNTLNSESMTSKERCLAVLQGRQPDRVPVFPLMMFFPADRAGISYRQYATDAAALTEAQINLFEKYGVDALTVSTDPYRISADIGAPMAYPEDRVPYVVYPFLRSREDFMAIKRPDPFKKGSRMHDRIRAVELLAKAVGDKALLLGWVEMPFAEACDWFGLSEFMMMLYDDPELAHAVLDFITEIEIDFALAQLDAGAPMIGCGDAAASLLSADLYNTFALPYERRVTEAVRRAGGMTKLHICGNSAHILDDLVTCGADLFNIDHMVDFDRACEAFGKAGKAFKGNLDPVERIMQATPEAAEAAAMACLERARGLSYMLSAGCEIPAATPDEVYFAFARAPQKLA